jgi:hypothetical protein
MLFLRLLNIFITAILFYVFFTFTLFVHAATDEKQLFSRTAFEKWEKYIKLIHVEGKVDIKLTRKQQLDYEDSSYVLASYPCMLKEFSTKDGSFNVVGFCPEYYFHISSKTKENNFWKIEKIEKIEPLKTIFVSNEENSTQQSKEKRLFLQELCPGLLVYGSNYLPTILELPEFHIKKIEIDNTTGKKIQVTFEFIPEDDKYPLFLRMKGHLILREDYYLIEKGNLFLLFGEHEEPRQIDIEYDESFSIPFPKNFDKIVNKDFSGKVIDSDNILYELKEIDKPKSSRFTLSHYGLPEPDFDNSRRTNRVRYVLMGIGALLIGIALWKMYKKRRENTT